MKDGLLGALLLMLVGLGCEGQVTYAVGEYRDFKIGVADVPSRGDGPEEAGGGPDGEPYDDEGDAPQPPNDIPSLPYADRIPWYLMDIPSVQRDLAPPMLHSDFRSVKAGDDVRVIVSPQDGAVRTDMAQPLQTKGVCEPCETADECGAFEDLCLWYEDTGETFCSRECAWIACPHGMECTDIQTEDGVTPQCTPADRSCVGDLPLCDPPCEIGEVCLGGECLIAAECDPPCEFGEICRDRVCVPNEPDDGLGVCTGTPEECEAARAVNDYRANHFQQGECNNRLRWHDRLGQLAHDHQSGPFVQHSSYGYIECCGQAYGVTETAEWICEYTPGIEDHCASNGAYVMSHHCACMYCNNTTIGVGVYQGGATYMTIIFGDDDGNPSW